MLELKLLIDRLLATLSANRVAAIANFLVSGGALLAALLGEFGTEAANTGVAITAIANKAATVLMFLRGAQKWEALTAPVPEPYGDPHMTLEEIADVVDGDMGAEDEPLGR